MQVVKIILMATVIVQISLAMPMTASFVEENLNNELIQGPVEEPKEATLETKQMSQSEEVIENINPENNISLESEEPATLIVEQQQQQPFTMTKDFAKDMGEIPFENPTMFVSSLPDLQKLQRDQLLALAMAQFMQYVQSVVHESETKLPNILKDFSNMKDLKFENQMKSIEEYLKQLEDYKIESQQFVTNTFRIPEKYENLLVDLKSKSMGNFEMQQILENYDLSNYEQYIDNYLQLLKQMVDNEFKRFSSDFTTFEKDSQETVKKFYMNILNQSELKNYVESLSKLFKF